MGAKGSVLLRLQAASHPSLRSHQEHLHRTLGLFSLEERQCQYHTAQQIASNRAS